MVAVAARPALRPSATIKAANRGIHEHDVCGNGLMRTEVPAVEAGDAVMSNPSFERTRRLAACSSGRLWRRAAQLQR